MNEQHRKAMGKALFLANRARGAGDVPVGAVIADENSRIVGCGWDCREVSHDFAGRVEIAALREAGHVRGAWRLTGCTLIVTLKPCTMCVGAILASRIDRVVLGARNPKAGAAGSLRDVLRDTRVPHSTEVIGGVFAQEAIMQLRSFSLSCRTPDGMPVVQAPAHEPSDLVAPIVVPYEENEAPDQIHEETNHNGGVPAQLVTPEAPATPTTLALSDENPRFGAFPVPLQYSRTSHRDTEISPLPCRAERLFSERISGNADNLADTPADSSLQPAAPVSQSLYRSTALVLQAVLPNTMRDPIACTVPQARSVHVRLAASVPEGLYVPVRPGRPVAQPLRASASQPRLTEPVTVPAPTEPPAPVVQVVPTPVGESPASISVSSVFPQRATSRQGARPWRPLPQAFEPEPAHRADYKLSPRQLDDVDPITSGTHVRRSVCHRGNARH